MVQPRWSSVADLMTVLTRTRVPVARLDRVKAAQRRRLDDSVDDAFRQACVSGDLDTAQELLAVLVAMHARRRTTFGSERRTISDSLQRAQEELDSHRQNRRLALAQAQSRS